MLNEHPAQIALVNTKGDFLEAQEQIAALKRQRIAMLEQYKNSTPPKSRYSPDGQHALMYAFGESA